MPQGLQRQLARSWLWLGMLALIGSGLFSVLLVVSRTPGINQWLPVADFFRVALVVHVDLSVLVWFIAMAGLLWSLNSAPGAGRSGRIAGWAAPALCTAGALLMSLAPFVERGEPIMANYIPVLDGPVFLAGLAVFAIGVGVLVLRCLLLAPKLGFSFDGGGALRFGLNASVVATAVALGAFAWSLAVVPTPLAGKAYYEILFWGGGHALQFTWTLLMLVAWLWLASACGAPVRLSPRAGVGDVRAGVARRVRDAVCLSRARHRVGGAPQPAHLGDARGRRPGHRADRHWPWCLRCAARGRPSRPSGRCARRCSLRCCCSPLVA